MILVVASAAFSFDVSGQTEKDVRRKSKTPEKQNSDVPKEESAAAISLPNPNDQPLSVGVEILKRANAAHGGNALDNLKALQMTGRQRHDVAFSEFKILIDIPRNRVRMETRAKGNFFYVQQIQGKEGWIFSGGKSGEISEAEKNDLRRTFYDGFMILRSSVLKDIKLEKVSVDETNELKTLQVAIDGEKYLLTFDAGNRLVARQSSLDASLYINECMSEKLDLYDDFRAVDGIKIPYRTASNLVLKPNSSAPCQARAFLDVFDLSEIKVNPSLTEKDWAIPR